MRADIFLSSRRPSTLQGKRKRLERITRGIRTISTGEGDNLARFRPFLFTSREAERRIPFAKTGEIFVHDVSARCVRIVTRRSRI